jgi:hypothetical protein
MPSTKQLITAAIRDPSAQIPVLAVEARNAIGSNDAKRALPIVMTLLSLSVDRKQADSGHRDLIDWLLNQETSLQMVLWAVLFARMISDPALEQKALALAPSSTLAR